MKKLHVIVISALFLILSISFIEMKLPNTFQSLDSRLHDFLFILRGEQTPSGDVVIIDIDEKSLEMYGQWPWSRDVVAKLINNLTFGGAGIIGLDIVFAEADKTSPIHIANKLNIPANDLEDYDDLLAKTILSSPVIGGYFFNFDKNTTHAPSIPAIVLEKGVPEKTHIIHSEGITLNIEPIQSAFYSTGFFNNTPDESGIVRSVPLVIRYNDSLYPSLALEMIRIYSQSSKIFVNNSKNGVESIALNDLKIPTDFGARIYVNLLGPRETFEYISATDILGGEFNTSKIEGKFVLIGTSAVGLADLRATAFDNLMPGVEIHANVIESIIQKNFLVKSVDAMAYDVTITIATIILSTLIFSLISEWFILPTLFLLIYLNYIFHTYIFFELGHIVNILFPIFALLASMFSVILINYIFTSSQKKQLQKAFAKKVSPQVMNDIISHSDEGLLTPKEKEISIFFSDIRSFTNISEKIGNPSKLITMLNQYMTPMVDIIIKHHGTVDKFIGDAVMAYWNAPVDVKEHQDKAVMSALEQLGRLHDLNASISKVYDVRIDIGIGIHSGNATIGEMGSEGRSDYTIIGDNVNLASRLEGLCKPYGVKLIISEFTKIGLKKEYVIRDLDFVKVKGKSKPVKIYEVLAFGKADKEVQEELDLYNIALNLYHNANFKESKIHFESLHVTYNHFLYEMYATRCQTLINEGVKEFDGVFTFTTK